LLAQPCAECLACHCGLCVARLAPRGIDLLRGLLDKNKTFRPKKKFEPGTALLPPP